MLSAKIMFTLLTMGKVNFLINVFGEKPLRVFCVKLEIDNVLIHTHTHTHIFTCNIRNIYRLNQILSALSVKIWSSLRISYCRTQRGGQSICFKTKMKSYKDLTYILKSVGLLGRSWRVPL